MWRFKPFTHRETASLEGRSIDVGNIKVHVRNLIAEGGFSCVYLARDALHSSRLYGLKHIICNDGESLELVMKEIFVMKLLNGHPNIIKLISHAIIDMGRIKEALLVMEFCERSLVTFLENGAHFLEEKHILLIFRDVCNAVFAMHNQNPPIAHRDLKAENVLLGADGAWKLCDFGSTSSDHKSFTRPEEMGIEEDNIRKHTTPAYRAPEMWDLYRRDVISEKVDIWALGCLLYRICFLKSAFDGESKLQITNVNYHIPELQKYSAAMIGLIKDMLQGSPDARPDITQIWFRVNQMLPMELQKDLPDSSSLAKDMCPRTAMPYQEGFPKGVDMMLRRGPLPASNECNQRTRVSSNKEKQQPTLPQSTAKANGDGAQVGSFWSTQHAQNPQVIPDKAPPNGRGHEITVSPMEKQHIAQKTKLSHNDIKATLQNNYFDASVITLNTTQQTSSSSSTNLSESKPVKEEQSVGVKKLKDQLKQVNLEKAEIASKYEKLTAICRSQRQEIQELKCALSAFTGTSPSKDCSKSQINPASLHSTTSQKEKLDPNLLELEQAMLASSTAALPAPPQSSVAPSQVPKPWQAFDDEPKAKPRPNNNFSGLSWPINGGQSTWGFNQGNNVSAHSSQMPSAAAPSWGTSSQRFGSGLEKKLSPNQPSSWTGF